MIDLRNVSKTYPGGNVALHDVNLHLDDGEFAFIVGASGAGKSTLLKLLLHEEKPTTGQIYVNDFAVHKLKPSQVPYLRRSLGIVFQDFRLIPSLNVYDNVAFSLRAVGASKQEIRKKVPFMLELVGLQDKFKSRPDALSGGEQQRVALARALVNNPQIIIADEPTGNVDPERSMEIVSLLEQINKLGPGILMVTHDHNLVHRFRKRVIRIEDGTVLSDRKGGIY